MMAFALFETVKARIFPSQVPVIQPATPKPLKILLAEDCPARLPAIHPRGPLKAGLLVFAALTAAITWGECSQRARRFDDLYAAFAGYAAASRYAPMDTARREEAEKALDKAGGSIAFPWDVDHFLAYLRAKDIYFTCHADPAAPQGLDCYAARIARTFRRDGVKYHMTRVRATGFDGFASLADDSDGPRIFTVGPQCGTPEVNIQMDALERRARRIRGEWRDIERNHVRLLSGSPDWDPALEAHYLVLSRFPEAAMEEEFLARDLAGAIAHEEQHMKDWGKGFGRHDDEVRAYLVGLKSSPDTLATFEVLASKEPETPGDRLYRDVGLRIMDGLMTFPDMTSKRDLYLLHPDELGRRAETLFQRWYGQSGERPTPTKPALALVHQGVYPDRE